MAIDFPSLLTALRDAYPAGDEPVPFDRAAILATLAMLESSGELDATGDEGDSRGLWQVNQPTWADEIGEFDGARAGDLAYQIDYIAPVFLEFLRDFENIEDEALSAARAPSFISTRTPAVWASIWWQYGGTQFRKWASSPAFQQDPSAPGFEKWRAANRREVLEDFERRQAKAQQVYSAAIQRPELVRAFWPAGASKSAAERKAGAPHPAIVPLVFIGLSGAAYLFVFQPNEETGERDKINPELAAWLKSIAAGVALPIAAEAAKRIISR